MGKITNYLVNFFSKSRCWDSNHRRTQPRGRKICTDSNPNKFGTLYHPVVDTIVVFTQTKWLSNMYTFQNVIAKHNYTFLSLNYLLKKYPERITTVQTNTVILHPWGQKGSVLRILKPARGRREDRSATSKGIIINDYSHY